MGVTCGLPMTSSGAKVTCSIRGARVAGCTGGVAVAVAEPNLAAADPTVVAKDFVVAVCLQHWQHARVCVCLQHCSTGSTGSTGNALQLTRRGYMCRR